MRRVWVVAIQKEAIIMSNEYAKQYWENGVLISEEITDSNYEEKN